MKQTDRKLQPPSSGKTGRNIRHYIHQQVARKNLWMMAVLFLLTAVGCSKENIHDKPALGPEEPGTNAVLLKEIIQEKLPSPAYHFFYDRKGKVRTIELSSGLISYDVVYEGGKIARLENKKHQTGLQYAYDGNRVRSILHYNEREENVDAVYHLEYHFNGLLKSLSYFSYLNTKNDSVLTRDFHFLYHDDGNLASVEEKRRGDNGGMVFSKAMMYAEYDEGRNMEGTGILRDFFDDLLYLPEITLQKNNPVVVKMATAGGKFLIRNHFQYQGEIPILKMSKMTQTGGSGMGDSFTFVTRYTYY
jgi:hypothetical protein